jgi:hypothetical protein
VSSHPDGADHPSSLADLWSRWMDGTYSVDQVVNQAPLDYRKGFA